MGGERRGRAAQEEAEGKKGNEGNSSSGVTGT